MRGRGRSRIRCPGEGRPGVQRPGSTVVRVRTNPAAVMEVPARSALDRGGSGSEVDVDLADPDPGLDHRTDRPHCIDSLNAPS